MSKKRKLDQVQPVTPKFTKAAEGLIEEPSHPDPPELVLRFQPGGTFETAVHHDHAQRQAQKAVSPQIREAVANPKEALPQVKRAYWKISGPLFTYEHEKEIHTAGHDAAARDTESRVKALQDRAAQRALQRSQSRDEKGLERD